MAVNPQGLAQIYAAMLNRPPQPFNGSAPGGMQAPPNAPPGIPPNVLQHLQTGGVPSAAGAALRNVPPASGGPTMIIQPTQANPNPMPSGVPTIPPGTSAAQAAPPGQPPPSLSPADQIAAMVSQIQPVPQFNPPTLAPPNKGFLLGEALSALVSPRLAPFAETALAYDTQTRGDDYKRAYQASLDKWNASKDAAVAANEGLVQKSELLKAQAAMPVPLAVDKTIPTPKIDAKMTPYQQDMEMAEYYDRVAGARLNAGALPAQVKEVADLATQYRQNAVQDRATDIADGKIPMKAGTIDPLTGQTVLPGSPAALAWEKLQGDAAFSSMRVAFEKERLNQGKERLDQAGQMAADRLRQSRELSLDRLNQQWNIHQDDQQTRMTVAILGVEAAGARATAAKQWQAGIDAYNNQMKALYGKAGAIAKSEDTSGYDAMLPPGGEAPSQPTGPGPIDINVNVTAAQQAAQQALGARQPVPRVGGGPSGISDPTLARIMGNSKVAALDPELRAKLINFAQSPDATQQGIIKNLSLIASGRKPSPVITPQQALAALAAVSYTGQ